MEAARGADGHQLLSGQLADVLKGNSGALMGGHSLDVHLVWGTLFATSYSGLLLASHCREYR
eukprot:3043736-Amphidinium_carterae.2